MKDAAPPPRKAAPAGSAATPLATKVFASAGLVAAMLLAVLVNVFVARHYKRWDVTRGGLFTLSDATVQTLHALEETVHVYVLLPANEPLSVATQNLLDAYRAETTRLDVHFTDPDRHPAEFLAIQQRYGIVAGKTDDGRIVTDASIIVVRGDRPFFITNRDLVEVDDADDTRARPRLEQALTGAIRSVLAKDQPVACFTSGHGEPANDGGAAGLGSLKEKLVKNNFVVKVLPASRSDKSHEAAHALDDCRVLIVAGPTEHVPAEDAAKYKAFVEGGGSALLAIGPQPDANGQAYLNLGLADVVGLAGVRIENDFVFELDPAMRSTRGFGETFLPTARPHAVTEAFVKAKDHAPPVVLTIASSMTPTGGGSAAPVPLLQTSEQSFGMADFFGWAKDTPVPMAGPADHKGPVTVAYAAERPGAKRSRIVVVSSAGAVLSANWQNDELRGTAVFVENAIAWLTARPAMVDIPNKPTYTAGIHASDEQLAGIFRYVILYMPLASVLLGVAVALRRRSTERRRTGKTA